MQAQAAMIQFNNMHMEELDQSEIAVNDSLLHADDLAEQAAMLEKYVSSMPSTVFG